MRRSAPPEGVTFLIPCKDQKHEFLRDALESVVRQDSPDWRALVLFPQDGPEPLRELVRSFADERLLAVNAPRPSFAGALNCGMELASTEFVAILLSDDRISEDAVSTIQSYRLAHPDADCLHSARMMIDASGNATSGVHPARRKITLQHFRTQGSPVKHLICWRRRLGLELGGMDEELSLHGCDDYDFPWRMAEAGARFQPIQECLYQYRRHNDAARLTTSVPVNRQIAILQRMFTKHGLMQAEICRYLNRATGGYLIRENAVEADEAPIHWCGYCQAASGLEPKFLSRGFRGFTPHRAYRLPRPGGRSAEREILLLNETGGTGADSDVDLAHPAESATVTVRRGCIRVTAARSATPLLYNALLDYAADIGAHTIVTPESGDAIRGVFRTSAAGGELRIGLAENADRRVSLTKEFRRVNPGTWLAEARWL